VAIVINSKDPEMEFKRDNLHVKEVVHELLAVKENTRIVIENPVDFKLRLFDNCWYRCTWSIQSVPGC
jgi:hypothetical protein